MRLISPEEAKKAYEILVQAAGAPGSRDEMDNFVHHIAHPYDPAEEYRFTGALGPGGKFRNGPTGPYVTCYPEHLNEKASSVIRTTNALLAGLFSQ